MEVAIFLDNNIYETLFSKHSSFNLGIAITAISIFATLIGFTLDKRFNLRVKLRIDFLLVASLFLLVSLAILFLVEGNWLNFYPLYFELLSAFLLLLAMGFVAYVIFYPIKKISKHTVKKLKREFDSFLFEKNKEDILKNISDINHFYISLLELSLVNKDAQYIFLNIFSSKYFLRTFSEYGFLFEKTILFLIENKESKSYHLKKFFNKLFSYSLINQDSYLNSFINEELYPDDLSAIDEIFFSNDINIDFELLFFDDIRYDFSIEGKISFIKMIRRYFKLIYQENNHVTFQNGYQQNIAYNDELIISMFNRVTEFFKNEYDLEKFSRLFKELEGVDWYYCWGNKTKDKSNSLKEYVGKFIYNIFHEVARAENIDNDSLLRLRLHSLFDDFFEIDQNEPKSNIALNAFIDKIKEKIIEKDFGSNKKGYYPALLKIYFLLFGHKIFSNNDNDYLIINLHLPILKQLKESFPRFYNGFKQEFYDKEDLPENIKEKLQMEGREIINSYLPENIIYSQQDNSLIYYYSGKNYGSKIELDQFSDLSTEIVATKI